MVIFHSYVSLPEGILDTCNVYLWNMYKEAYIRVMPCDTDITWPRNLLQFWLANPKKSLSLAMFDRQRVNPVLKSQWLMCYQHLSTFKSAKSI